MLQRFSPCRLLDGSSAPKGRDLWTGCQRPSSRSEGSKSSKTSPSYFGNPRTQPSLRCTIRRNPVYCLVPYARSTKSARWMWILRCFRRRVQYLSTIPTLQELTHQHGFQLSRMVWETLGRLSRAYLSLHFDSSTSPEEAVAFLESLPVPELDNLSFSASWIHSQVSLDYMFGAILHFSFLRSCHIGVRSGTWDSTGGLNEERSVLSPLYCLRYLEVLSMSCLHILRTPEELKQAEEAWPHLRKLRINSGAAPIPCGRIRLDDLLLIGQHFLFLGQATVELLPVEERWTWDRAAFDDAPECLAHLFVSNRSRISPAATTEVASFLARYFRYPSTCLQTLDADFEGSVDYRTVFRETLQLAH